MKIPYEVAKAIGDRFTSDYSQGYVAHYSEGHLDPKRPGAVDVTVVNIATCDTQHTTANYSGVDRYELEGLPEQWRAWGDSVAEHGEGHRLWHYAVARLIELKPHRLQDQRPLTKSELDLLRRIKDHDEAEKLMAREGLI